MSVPSLHTLPVELLHHIFGYLDVQTLLFSIRNVCKRLNTIVNAYNRYEIDLISISKPEFCRICRVIRPENIISLTLSDDDRTPYQIRLFLSFFPFDHFTHLRSLTLLKIEESDLFLILVCISNYSLTSLSIEFRVSDCCSATLQAILLSFIAQCNLRKLDLNMWYREIEMISWPIQHSLEYLRLDRCTFDQFHVILRHSPNLRTFVLRECHMCTNDGPISQPIVPIVAHQLTSLTLGTSYMRMKTLETLLLVTPSLVHLKLLVWTNTFDSVIDGLRWEQFIRTNLVLLTKFEFFFDDWTDADQMQVDIESLIQSFRTPFWIEEKLWFVTCDQIKKPALIRLYSIPVCNTLFTYYSESNKTSYSTLTTIDHEEETMDRVSEVHLNMNEALIPISTETNLSNQSFFRKATHLSLNLNGKWPYGSLKVLQTLVDLSYLVRISIQIVFHHSTHADLIDYITTMLNQAHNTRSLKITYICLDEPLINIEALCSIVPQHVKHFRVSLQNINDMKLIIERLPHLSSATFDFCHTLMKFAEIDRWLKGKRKDSTFRIDTNCIRIWLGTINSEENETLWAKYFVNRFRRKELVRETTIRKHS